MTRGLYAEDMCQCSKTTHLFHQNILQGPVETSNLHSVHPFPNAGGGLGLTPAL